MTFCKVYDTLKLKEDLREKKMKYFLRSREFLYIILKFSDPIIIEFREINSAPDS